MKTKICSKCKRKLLSTTEYFHKDNGCKDGLYSICKECKNKIERENYNSEKNRNRKLKRKYGITLSDYDEMLYKQQGRCKICGVHHTELNHSLCIDHSHETGEVRGLLCDKCNRTLGNVNDNPFILIKAAKYLKKQL